MGWYVIQVLWAEMESEEVCFQTAVEDTVDSESVVLIAVGSAFHSFGARREKSLGRVER